MSLNAVKLRVNDARFYVRNVQTRMPFRYGVAYLTGYPILHVRVFAELEDGTPCEGVAADCLPPKWFDKDLSKDYRDNINDLLAVTYAAHDAYLGMNGDARSPFDLFREGYDTTLDFADSQELNHLTGSFGASLFERAVIDAVGNGTGLPFHTLVRDNLLGIDMSAIHPELGDTQPREIVLESPLDTMWVRHTVGLADPIIGSDVGVGERLTDGLPQTLSEYVDRQGLRYFKVKVSGESDVDIMRLQAIAGVLDAHIEEPYYVTFDGNEQYKRMGDFLLLIEELWSRPVFKRFWDSILFIEQPLQRDVALDEDNAAMIRRLSSEKAMIIDESDGDLDTFKRAIALGYRGVSSKNCKGVYKSLMNLALAKLYTSHAANGEQYFMSGEDLANAAIVPLHQDLATLATWGINHVERNGHHYLRGLAHLSDEEQSACLQIHANLYTVRDELPQLRVEDGRIQIGSLQTPGYALGVPIDYDSMIALDDWTFESLGV
ncbi:MAG: mandelate racemase [Candidatus Poribacteria bacterium]|nr:mandelate racemase [Candidatus Poribacteria bacterium]